MTGVCQEWDVNIVVCLTSSIRSIVGVHRGSVISEVLLKLFEQLTGKLPVLAASEHIYEVCRD